MPNLFLIELAHMLGFGPLNNHSSEMPYFHLAEGVFTAHPSGVDDTLDADVSTALASLLPLEKETIRQVVMPRQTRNELTDSLLRYYTMHVAGFRPLQSIQVLRIMLHY
jgi:DNA repair protein RecO (recombination protein O)